MTQCALELLRSIVVMSICMQLLMQPEFQDLNLIPCTLQACIVVQKSASPCQDVYSCEHIIPTALSEVCNGVHYVVLAQVAHIYTLHGTNK